MNASSLELLYAADQARFEIVELEDEIALVVALGAVRTADALEAGRVFMQRAGRCAAIWDWRGADFRELDVQQMRMLVADSARFYRDLRLRPVAHVVATEVGFGMVRMAETVFETSFQLDDRDHNRRVRVFRDPDEALAWVRGALHD